MPNNDTDIITASGVTRLTVRWQNMAGTWRWAGKLLAQAVAAQAKADRLHARAATALAQAADAYTHIN